MPRAAGCGVRGGQERDLGRDTFKPGRHGGLRHGWRLQRCQTGATAREYDTRQRDPQPGSIESVNSSNHICAGSYHASQLQCHRPPTQSAPAASAALRGYTDIMKHLLWIALISIGLACGGPPTQSLQSGAASEPVDDLDVAEDARWPRTADRAATDMAQRPRANASLRRAPSPARRPLPRYRGKRIDLDLKDADLHNVFRLLADVGGVNIVVTDDVKGRVTIRLSRVPWDQALHTIVRTKRLHLAVEDNVYMISTRASG